jgi:hypothetical protein
VCKNGFIGLEAQFRPVVRAIFKNGFIGTEPMEAQFRPVVRAILMAVRLMAVSWVNKLAELLRLVERGQLCLGLYSTTLGLRE